MPRYIVMLNSPALVDTEDKDAALTQAAQLAADRPGLAFDVFEQVAQSFAEPPVPVQVVAVTKDAATLDAERTAAKEAAQLDAVAADAIAEPPVKS